MMGYEGIPFIVGLVFNACLDSMKCGRNFFAILIENFYVLSIIVNILSVEIDSCSRLY